MRKTLLILFVIVVLLLLLLATIPTDTLSWIMGRARANSQAIATEFGPPSPTATITPTLTPTATMMIPPTELGPQVTEVVPPAQATAGIPTMAPTDELTYEDLPMWGENPDMMKYRETLSALSRVGELAYLVTGYQTVCAVGENRDRFVGFSFQTPKAISAGLNVVGIDLPDVISINFDSEVHTSTTVCGSQLFGVRMLDVINTATVTGTGEWVDSNTAGKRINPTTQQEELFQIWEQPADFQSQPTICLVGIHVNGEIVNSTYNQPGILYRAFFPYDMGNQFEIDFKAARAEFEAQDKLQKGAETARESLVNGKANAALCGLMSMVDGGASQLQSCTFVPRVPSVIQFCGDLDAQNGMVTPTPIP